MIITCKNCETIYRTSGIAFYDGERKVRCKVCGHVWTARPNDLHSESELNKKKEDEPSFAQELSVFDAEQSAEDIVMDILDGDERPNFDEDFVIPDNTMPIMDAKPGNMQPNLFGVAVFVFCTLLTLALLLGLRSPIVHAAPSMNAFYKVFDMRVKAPGEGLRLSNMMARARTEDAGSRTLEISLRVDNISKEDILYPSLKATVYGGYGVALKTWEFRPAEVTLAAGKSIPVNLVFEDMPQAARSVDIKVIH